MKRLLAAVAVCLLAGCTPDEIAAVEGAYRAAILEQRPANFTITADCTGLKIHGENWPDGSLITPGLDGASPLFYLHPDNGTVDGFWPLDTHWAPGTTGTYHWSVNGNGPGVTLAESGDVTC